MRVLFSVHLFPPSHNCGGEYFIHAIAKYLISQGHEVRVLLHQAKQHGITDIYRYEGVDVFPFNSTPEYLIGWADILLTHLEYANWTIQIGRIFKKPVVFVSHNTHVYDCIISNPGVGVVYNCNAMRDILKYPNRSAVIHPPVDASKFRADHDPASAEYITMVNLDENKGGKILRRVAAALPERKFLAVRGSYSEPGYIGQIVDQPSNVTILPNSPDILQVYMRTRILLMPSRYESWGMTATEAMSSGIPVICTTTFGLKENCGDAGMFIPERGPIKQAPYDPSIGDFDMSKHQDDGDTYDITPILKAIKRLDSKKVYGEQSAKCRAQAASHGSLKELASLEQFLLSLAYEKTPV